MFIGIKQIQLRKYVHKSKKNVESRVCLSAVLFSRAFWSFEKCKIFCCAGAPQHNKKKKLYRWQGIHTFYRGKFVNNALYKCLSLRRVKEAESEKNKTTQYVHLVGNWSPDQILPRFLRIWFAMNEGARLLMRNTIITKLYIWQGIHTLLSGKFVIKTLYNLFSDLTFSL